MKPYFINKLNFAPQDPARKDDWILEEDFGLVYGNYLCIAPVGSAMDGASIPKMLQAALGTPMSKKNRFWACFHDTFYRGELVIIDLRICPLDAKSAFNMWKDLENLHISPYQLGRKWGDVMMKNGSMIADGQGRIKRGIVYPGVRVGGWMSYYRYLEKNT